MLSSVSVAAIALAGMATAQTFTDCNPLEKTCPTDKSLGGYLSSDFTKMGSDLDSNWKKADATVVSTDKSLGLVFPISKYTEAPTISSTGYLFFGRVSAIVRSSEGTGTVSSFILESDDLDEIDWEWLGSDDANVQTNFFGKGNTTTYDRGGVSPVSTPIDTFHNYTIVWTKDSINWLIDDVSVRVLPYSDPKALGGQNYPQTPMKVKMGSWVACPNATAAEEGSPLYYTCEWAGGPFDAKNGPYNMYVQSVEIDNFSNACEYTYGDKTGSYQSIKESGTCSDGPKDAGSSSSSSTKSGSSTLVSSTKSSSATATGSGSSSSATGTGSSGTSASGTGSSPSSTSSGPAQVSANASSSMKPKTQYGMIDAVVVGFGLFMGYLVM